MKRTSLLLALAVAAGAALLARPARPLPALTPTDESDGLGPITVRRYWLDLSGPGWDAETTTSFLLGQLPEMVPRTLAAFHQQTGRPGHPQVGDRFFIRMLLLRRAFVRLERREPWGYRFQTLRQHAESGFSEFRAESLGTDLLRLEFSSQVRASSWLDRLGYLAGVRFAQRLTWQGALRRLARQVGGTVVSQGHVTREFPAAPRPLKLS